MPQIRNILCPLDLSETSSTAFDYAAMLARWYGASLTVMEMIWVGVPAVRDLSTPLVLTPEMVQEYSEGLNAFVAAKGPVGVPVHVVLREGPMVQGILQEARTLPADLIVMGAHGLGGFDRFVLGSVTEKVLRQAACPVLTVPHRAMGAPVHAQPFKTILCPVDFSPGSMTAIRFAVRLAEESGKRVVLLHVFDWDVDRVPPPGLGPEFAASRRNSEEEAVRELRARVPEDARQWCEVRELTAVGRPYEQILRTAEAEAADLIVMGVHGRNSLDLALFGSTTNQVVRRAACPVLTVRP